MGIYINKGNAGFRAVRNSEYVDKTGLIGVVNRTLFTERRYSCVTRSRRFGKTLAAKTLAAYYDCSCQSRELFADLGIAKDPTFEEHLNKYPVIFIDMNSFYTRYRHDNIIAHINDEVKAEVCEAFPDVAVGESDDLLNTLLRVVMATGQHFVMIIDEWDVICREFKPDSQQMNDFHNWMRRMFNPHCS